MSLRPKPDPSHARARTTGHLVGPVFLPRGRLAAVLLVVTLVGAVSNLTSVAASAQSSEVTIEKLTNGVDADAAPGPILDVGAPVQWSYTVTVTGSTTLYDLIVSDSSGVVPNCDVNGDGNPDGTHVHPGPLNGGQSFGCTASGTVHGADQGTFAATAKVKAFDFTATAQFEDVDPSHHTPLAPFQADPKVTVQTLVNGVDADVSPGPYIPEGTPVNWTYVVTNAGNVPLTSIVVAGSGGATVTCGPAGTTDMIPGPLAPGSTVTCTGTAPAAAATEGPQAGSGSVEATAVDPRTGAVLENLSASDPLNYTPVQLPAALAFTGPSSPIAPTGLALAAGGALVWFLGRRRMARPVMEP